MLPRQRYRPQAYPPGPVFTQFGDDLLRRGVKAYSEAHGEIMQKLSNRRMMDVHKSRLQDHGFHLYQDPHDAGVAAFDIPEPSAPAAPWSNLSAEAARPWKSIPHLAETPYGSPEASRAPSPERHEGPERPDGSERPDGEEEEARPSAGSYGPLRLGDRARSSVAWAASSAAQPLADLGSYAGQSLQNNVKGTIELGSAAAGFAGTALLSGVQQVGSASRRASGAAASAASSAAASAVADAGSLALSTAAPPLTALGNYASQRLQNNVRDTLAIGNAVGKQAGQLMQVAKPLVVAGVGHTVALAG